MGLSNTSVIINMNSAGIRCKYSLSAPPSFFWSYICPDICTVSMSLSCNPCILKELTPPRGPGGQCSHSTTHHHCPGPRGTEQSRHNDLTWKRWVTSLPSSSGHWDLGRRWEPAGPVTEDEVSMQRRRVSRESCRAPEPVGQADQEVCSDSAPQLGEPINILTVQPFRLASCFL